MFDSLLRKKSQKSVVRKSGDRKRQGGSRKADSLTVKPKSRCSSRLKLFRKKALAEEEQQRKPYIPNGCISNILIRLPVESLGRLQLVCKTWYNIINDTYFIDAHLCCSETETVLIHLTSEPPSTPKNKTLTLFSVEDNLLEMEPRPSFNNPRPYRKWYIKYLAFKDGKLKVGDFFVTCFGEIKSSCNGLILILNEGWIVVMNPVARSLVSVPLGSKDYGSQCLKSYSLAFSPTLSKHKVVHLFFDRSGFLRIETIKICIGDSWKLVEGPNIRDILSFTPAAVYAIDALHWINEDYPHKRFLMSFETDKEKFQVIALPNGNPTYQCGYILEMRRLLCYVAHEAENQVDIWVLKGLGGESMIKHHTITTDYRIVHLIPLFGSRINEEIIFREKNYGRYYFYTYSLQKRVLTKVEIPQKWASLWFVSELPHINSLAGWGAMDKFQEL